MRECKKIVGQTQQKRQCCLKIVKWPIARKSNWALSGIEPGSSVMRSGVIFSITGLRIGAKNPLCSNTELRSRLSINDNNWCYSKYNMKLLWTQCTFNKLLINNTVLFSFVVIRSDTLDLWSHCIFSLVLLKWPKPK